MARNGVKMALKIAIAMLAVGGAVLLGRLTVDAGAARSDGFRTGQSAGYSSGLTAGQEQGRQEGRALQEGAALPADSRQPVTDAFNAGYVAGRNDAFAGYDGGWGLGTPYVVVMAAGGNGVTYRIGPRTTIEPNVDYFLCPDGHSVCQQPRR